MNNRKGFSLIELLAVIVVLAIIALIAVPIVLNVIEKAKMGAAESSAYGYADAVEKSYVLAITDGTISNWPAKDENGCYTVADIKSFVKARGNKPTDDTKICFDAKNTVSAMIGTINDYEFTLQDNKVTVGDKNTEIVEELNGDSISVVAQALIDSNNGNTYTYMGGTYLKGAQTTNYVWYNGFMWMIMGVNEDGTVRLIADETVAMIPWGASGAGDWNAEGYIKDWLNDYFLSNLKPNLTSIIQEGEYFCIELGKSSSTARETCAANSIINSKVGLISLDEYNLAGADQSYLNVSQNQWTMTPVSTSDAWKFQLNVTNFGVTSAIGVRPIINVSAESVITGGNGTATDMYILNENKTITTGTIGENSTSGEYVLLEGKIYRVVSKDSDGIKLILNGYYDANNTGTISSTDEIVFGSNNVFSLESGIGLTLNTTVLEWLGLDALDKLVETTFYQGDAIEPGFKYENTLNETNSISGVKVGLIRLGEMLSGQSSTVTTKNYTETYSFINAVDYWTMSKHTTIYNGCQITAIGNVSYDSSTYTSIVRPVIKVRSNLPITGGNGTWNSPYEI